MKINELLLSEEEIIAEGIISSLKAGVDGVKQFAANIADAAKTHKELKSLDGKRGVNTANLRDESKRLHGELRTLASAASPKAKKAIDLTISKMGAFTLDKVYSSRNYYKDFVCYSLILPIAKLTGKDVGKFGIDRILDNLLGYVITIITGMPSLADIKDVTDVGVSLLKGANELATKINSLKPAQVAESLM